MKSGIYKIKASQWLEILEENVKGKSWFKICNEHELNTGQVNKWRNATNSKGVFAFVKEAQDLTEIEFNKIVSRLKNERIKKFKRENS